MGALFTGLLAMSKLQPNLADTAYNQLTPGADFFARHAVVAQTVLGATKFCISDHRPSTGLSGLALSLGFM